MSFEPWNMKKKRNEKNYNKNDINTYILIVLETIKNES